MTTMQLTRSRPNTVILDLDGEQWYVHSDGGRRRLDSLHRFNDKRMFVNSKYVPQTHPLWKSGRYKSFNDAAFSSFENYKKITKGEVYIITNKAWPEWIKVGKAVNTEDRLKGYQTSDPFRSYKIHHSFKVNNRHTFEVFSHDLLKGECTEFKNEWFKMNPCQAKKLMEVEHEKW